MIPRHIQVGAYRYDVKVDLDLIHAESVATQSDLLGSANHRDGYLAVRPDMAPDQTADTILHEVLHAISFQVGIVSELGAEDEERVINRLSPLLLDTLRRNPDLVDYLMDRS